MTTLERIQLCRAEEQADAVRSLTGKDRSCSFLGCAIRICWWNESGLCTRCAQREWRRVNLSNKKQITHKFLEGAT